MKEGRARSGSPVRWNEAHSTLDPFSASHIIPVWSTQPAPCQSLVTPLCPGRKRFPSPGKCPPPGNPFFSQPLLGAWPRTDQRDRGKAQGGPKSHLPAERPQASRVERGERVEGTHQRPINDSWPLFTWHFIPKVTLTLHSKFIKRHVALIPILKMETPTFRRVNERRDSPGVKRYLSQQGACCPT